MKTEEEIQRQIEIEKAIAKEIIKIDGFPNAEMQALIHHQKAESLEWVLGKA